MLTVGVTDYIKASRLMSTIQHFLTGSSDPHQYLIDACYVLMAQDNPVLANIVGQMLKQLGEL